MKTRERKIVLILVIVVSIVFAATISSDNVNQPKEAEDETMQLIEYSNEEIAEVIVDSMSLHEKICQMLFVTPEVLTDQKNVTVTDESFKEALKEYPVGGIIYFADNLTDEEQTTEMISTIQEYAKQVIGIGLFIGVDEEGGSIARVADKLGTTQFDDMSVYGEENNYETAYYIGSTLASDISRFGFNVDFAPVADVLTNQENEVVKRRAFGSDVSVVTNMVTGVVQGLQDGNVIAVAKHFPNHGATGEDSHDGFAVSERTLDELKETDLQPYYAAVEQGVGMIMAGHITMSAIDPDYPASLSYEIVTELLKEEMNFQGVVITDAMNMGAIAENYSVSQSAVLAASAGCDMLLYVTDIETVVNALTEALEDGTITVERIDESVKRIIKLKLDYGILQPANIVGDIAGKIYAK